MAPTAGRKRKQAEEGRHTDTDVSSTSTSTSGSSSGRDDDDDDDDERSSSISSSDDGQDADAVRHFPNDADAPPVVNFSFDFDEPQTSDFHALKALLTSYAPGHGVDRSALAEAIIAAPGATLIRATQGGDDGDGDGDGDGDDGSVIGVGAVLREGGSGLLRGLFGEGALPGRVAGVERVVVIERLMNSPPQLGGPLLRAIFEGERSSKKKGKEKGKERCVVVGKVWEGEGGERGYALPEFGCVVDEVGEGEVVWVRGEGGGWGRFVAVVEGGVEGWVGRVEGCLG